MAAPADSGIYEIVNLKNGKRYVGSAISLRRRRIEHFTQLRHGKHINRHLQASFKRHGEQSFQFQVLERCEPQQLIVREQLALDQRRPEYNICRRAGSTLGVKRTPAQCAAQSARMKGSVISAEHRAKLSAAMKGRVFDPEHLSKIASALAAKRAAGWRPSAEAIEKGAAKRRGKRQSAETCAKHAAHRKRLWADEAYAKRQIAIFQASCHSPEARQKRALAMRGRPGHPHSEEAKAKISARAKALWADANWRAEKLAETLNKLQSPAAIAKRSAKMRGRKLSGEQIAKQSAAMKQVWDSEEYRAKRAATFALPETRRRMSESHKGRIPGAETRAKMSECRRGLLNAAAIHTQVEIVNDAGERLVGLPMDLRAKTGISASAMSQLMSGKQATSKGWRLAPFIGGVP